MSDSRAKQLGQLLSDIADSREAAFDVGWNACLDAVDNLIDEHSGKHVVGAGWILRERLACGAWGTLVPLSRLLNDDQGRIRMEKTA